MTIPLATTTVTVAAPAVHEPYETATLTVRLVDVPAHISAPTAAERAGDAGMERVDAVLFCGVPVARNEVVTDAGTGAVYRAAWTFRRTGLGLDHTKVGLVATAGGVPG